MSSSDRYLEAIGAKRPPGSLLKPCITEITDDDQEPDILTGGGEGDNGKNEGADGGDTKGFVGADKKCQNGSIVEEITETREDSVTLVEPEAAIETEKENMMDNASNNEENESNVPAVEEKENLESKEENGIGEEKSIEDEVSDDVVMNEDSVTHEKEREEDTSVIASSHTDEIGKKRENQTDAFMIRYRYKEEAVTHVLPLPEERRISKDF